MRPLLLFENIRGDKHSVFLTGENKLEVTKSEGSKQFAFDLIHGDQTNQAEVFERSNIAGLLDNVFDGFSATILAYGQTGSGKTFTSIKKIAWKRR